MTLGNNKLPVLVILLMFIQSCKNEPPLSDAPLSGGSCFSVCNPMDLNYRFCSDTPSRREAADPTILLFKDRYFLFASKSEGYWHSQNLMQWQFIKNNQLPVEEYAPAVIAIGDTVYFMASSDTKCTIYKSSDLLSGNWEVAVDSFAVQAIDPAFFLDDDQRLYFYWGCSDQTPIWGVEVDYRNSFSIAGKPKELVYASTQKHGWEVPGNYNRKTAAKPWIEGAWVNKRNGVYYLQYSGPGTEYKSYCDGVYTATDPLGPYKLAEHNPFSYKPEGFIAGAGHGNTFEDVHGNYWHVATGTISTKHVFERRLVLYPVFFDDDSLMYADTRYGDYPLLMPDKKIESKEGIFPGWMLLSYGKAVEVSSSLVGHARENITDENIRTYWSAKTGDQSEFVSLDLGRQMEVCAVQINFAEHNTQLYGRQAGLMHRYVLEASSDNENWLVLDDKSDKGTENTHVYLQLKEKELCRYIRIRNLTVPGGCFALSGLRVFGNAQGEIPEPPGIFKAARDSDDRRTAHLAWKKVPAAVGYNIRYGTAEDKLYHSYLVYADTSVSINSLNADQQYFFSVESFNESGVSQLGEIINVP